MSSDTPTPGQLTLGELIEALEAVDQDATLPYGFDKPHSYRGYYDELAFELRHDIPVADALAAARSALGVVFQGYKGGDYRMDEDTLVWLSAYGSTGEQLGAITLHLMLRAA